MFSLRQSQRSTRSAPFLLVAAVVLMTATATMLMATTPATAQQMESSPSPSPSPSSPAPSPSSSHSPGGHGGSGSSSGAVAVPDDPCFSDPSAPECANYIRPKGSWLPELTKLCDAMDYMPGCTLWRECQASNSLEGYCYHPSLVGNICLDMPRMKGCEPWNALCGNKSKKSVVPQCIKPGPLPSLPSTEQATKSVQSMCSSHSMPGCDACRQGAAAGSEGCRDPLRSLAAVCASMPGMRDCKQLADACASKGAAELFPKTCELVSPQQQKKGEKKPNASLASSSSSSSSGFDLPPMRMWLHADAEDIVLARQWVPRKPATVAAACAGAVGGGFLSQALRAARGAAEAALASNLRRTLISGGGGGNRRRRFGLFSSPSAGARLGRNALRAAATFASSLLDLLLMLVAMTFSWPLILSVAGGYGLGALAFGGLGEPRLVGGGGTSVAAAGGGGGGGGFAASAAAGENGGAKGGGAQAPAGNGGFSSVEGIHLHGGTESVDGASCCDTGGGIGRGKMGGGSDGDVAASAAAAAAAAAENGKGRGWFGK